MSTLCAMTLIVSAAARADGQSESAWPTLVPQAEAAERATENGQSRLAVSDTLERLGKAQASITGPRPQQCFDLMQSAASNLCLPSEAWCKDHDRTHAIQLARDAVGCYRGDVAGAKPESPSGSGDSNLRKSEQAGYDFYAKVHPGQPRVGDVPGQAYVPGSAPRANPSSNPWVNINLPGCNNGLR